MPNPPHAIGYSCLATLPIPTTGDINGFTLGGGGEPAPISSLGELAESIRRGEFTGRAVFNVIAGW